MTVTFPFPTDPAGIDASGRETLLWVPAIADLASPTVDELNSGLNLSCIVESFGVSSEQGTVTRKKLCYTSPAERPGRVKYSIEPLIYDYDPQAPDDAEGEYGHYAAMKPGLSGYLVDRRGLTKDHAIETGQYVDVYPATLGAQGRVAIDVEAEGQTLRISQTVAVSGDPVFDAKVA